MGKSLNIMSFMVFELYSLKTEASRSALLRAVYEKAHSIAEWRLDIVCPAADGELLGKLLPKLDADHKEFDEDIEVNLPNQYHPSDSEWPHYQSCARS